MSAETAARVERAHPYRLYAGAGVLLGLGAPLGVHALRRLLPSKPAAPRAREALWYMSLTTPVVFGLFGRLLGGREERLREASAHVERLREEFAAVVAHDLRSPIHAILLQLELLMSEADGDHVHAPVSALERL